MNEYEQARSMLEQVLDRLLRVLRNVEKFKFNPNMHEELSSESNFQIDFLKK